MATAAVGAGPRAPPAVLELVAWEPAALVAEETAAPMLLVAAATVWEMRLSSALALLRAAASVAVERKLFQLERAAPASLVRRWMSDEASAACEDHQPWPLVAMSLAMDLPSEMMLPAEEPTPLTNVDASETMPLTKVEASLKISGWGVGMGSGAACSFYMLAMISPMNTHGVDRISREESYSV